MNSIHIMLGFFFFFFLSHFCVCVGVGVEVEVVNNSNDETLVGYGVQTKLKYTTSEKP